MLSVHIGMAMVGHILVRLVVHRATVSLVLELNVRLLLMVLVVIMVVGNVRLLVVNGMIMEDRRLVMMVHVLIVVDGFVVDSLVMHGCLLMVSSGLSVLNTVLKASGVLGKVAKMATMTANAVLTVSSVSVLTVTSEAMLTVTSEAMLTVTSETVLTVGSVSVLTVGSVSVLSPVSGVAVVAMVAFAVTESVITMNISMGKAVLGNMAMVLSLNAHKSANCNKEASHLLNIV